MNFFPQPCAALPQSPRLRAKQGHATSAPAPRFTFNSHPRESTRKRVPQLRGASRKRGEKSKIKNPRVCAPTGVGASPLNSASRLRPDRRRGLIPRRLPAAFSLTEVVIAMGVAAVAFTSIIALFPLGLNMSKESYEETQAALIAQTILADLKDESTGSGTLGRSRYIQIGPNSQPTNTDNYLPIDFRTVSVTVYLAYKQELNLTNDTDPTGLPIMMRPSGYSTNPAVFYNSGSNGLSAVVKVTATQCFRINGAGASSNPMRVDISIETPGNAPLKNRSQFLFTGGTPP